MAHCEPKRLNQAPQRIGVIYRRFRKTDGFASQIMKSAIMDSRQTFSDQVRVSRSSFNFNGRPPYLGPALLGIPKERPEPEDFT
jgi:hypothetical protein